MYPVFLVIFYLSFARNLSDFYIIFKNKLSKRQRDRKIKKAVEAHIKEIENSASGHINYHSHATLDELDYSPDKGCNIDNFEYHIDTSRA